MPKTRTTAALLALALSAMAVPARAQDARARREAKARFKEGLALHDAGNDEQALIKFREAYTAYKSPAILFNIARAEQLTGHLLDAQHDYRACLADPSYASHAGEVNQRLDQLRGQLGHLRVQSPAGSSLVVDGQPVVDWSAPIDVLPGSHTITATDGWQVTRTVEAAAGKEVEVRIDAPPASAAASPPIPAPAAAAPSPAIAPPPSVPPNVAPEEPHASTARTVVVGALGVVALGALGTAIYLGAHSSSEADKAHSLNTQRGSTPCPAAGSSLCSSLSDAVDAQNRDAVASDVLYAVAGAAAIGAVASWLLWPSPHTSNGAWVAPWWGAHDGGIAARGSF